MRGAGKNAFIKGNIGLKNTEKLPLKNKLTYGVGAIGLDMSYGLYFSFFTKYCTDVLVLNAAALGVMMAIARIWDGKAALRLSRRPFNLGIV